jgi:hypothetical protein
MGKQKGQRGTRVIMEKTDVIANLVAGMKKFS